MFETAFGFLLKFTSLQFREGNLVFQAAPPVLFWAVLLILLAVFGGVYVLTNIYTSNSTRALSASIRSVALILLCLPFLEPALMLPEIVPDENFLAVMVDYSGSMSVKDGAIGETRYDDVREILTGEQASILPQLEDHFKIRFYNFSTEANRIDSLSTIGPNGWGTGLAASMSKVVSDFKGLPLAGILLFSDGGDNGNGDPRDVAEELRGLGVPLHIVGLGKETLENERELLEVKTNKGLRAGSGAEIELKVRSWVKETEPVGVSLYDGETLVHARRVNLKGEGKIDFVSFSYDPDNKDAREYTVTISPLPEESNLENNSLNLLIDSRRDTVRVLYFEGHLRQEFKFVKRAIDNDQVLDVATLSRTGTGKYFRQGIRNATELSGGFPTTEEDLFQFKAIIFGDIEAGYFSLEQLEIIERFIRKRGGGFLMLGGRKSFVEGDYWNTPIGDVLPVELDPQRRLVIQPKFRRPDIPEEEQGFEFIPTRAGLENPILKLTADMSDNKIAWGHMPRLFSINYFGRVKPGAIVLAEKAKDRLGDAEPILVIQRYGRGRSAALATASTWRWQMLNEATDDSHERFWRQLIRWLGTSAPDQVNIELPGDRPEPGTEFPIRSMVYEPDFNPSESVELIGRVTGPYEGVRSLKFLPEISEEGEYVAGFSPNDPGIHTIEVEARRNGRLIGRQHESFISRHSKEEFYNATLKRSLLENLVGMTNGVYYEPAQYTDIPKNLTSRRTATSIWRSEYLWDMPLIFLLVVILLSIEWIYRRYKGLP